MAPLVDALRVTMDLAGLPAKLSFHHVVDKCYDTSATVEEQHALLTFVGLFANMFDDADWASDFGKRWAAARKALVSRLSALD